MSPLERVIRATIAAEGPIRVDRYMELCLAHPEHGYYHARESIGAAGDFITAPEISQMFGELLGVWCSLAWSALGKPDHLLLVELGPGRGTLMRDLLRAAGSQSAFRAALDIRLVETSPRLRAAQADALAGNVPVAWHDSLAELPAGPTILLANEFFDALPARQFVLGADGWRERRVGVGDQGRLAFVEGPALAASIPAWASGLREGSLIETSPAREALAEAIGLRLTREGGAALVIDYGHARSAPGDTLQALQRHAYADPLEEPGTADLTSHVDFQALASAFERAGASTHGLLTQGAFLQALQIGERARVLKAKLDRAGQSQLERSVWRLVNEDGMGHLFKALLATGPNAPAPYPFDGIPR